MNLFSGRKDVFARFWQNSATGKSGYAPAKNDNGILLQLTETNIATHLAGQQLIGIYPLLKDNTSHFMAIDFDEASWLVDCVRAMGIASQNEIPCYLERSKSGNGAHVWFFFEKPVSAFKSRQLAKYLISQAGLSKDESSFDRIFPNQDQHTGKGYGNLIALPLNMTYLQKGNTAFIDLNLEIISDQWHYME